MTPWILINQNGGDVEKDIIYSSFIILKITCWQMPGCPHDGGDHKTIKIFIVFQESRPFMFRISAILFSKVSVFSLKLYILSFFVKIENTTHLNPIIFNGSLRRKIINRFPGNIGLKCISGNEKSFGQ